MDFIWTDDKKDDIIHNVKKKDQSSINMRGAYLWRVNKCVGPAVSPCHNFQLSCFGVGIHTATKQGMLQIFPCWSFFGQGAGAVGTIDEGAAQRNSGTTTRILNLSLAFYHLEYLGSCISLLSCVSAYMRMHMQRLFLLCDD